MNINKLTVHMAPELAQMERALADICADAGLLSPGLERVVTAGGKRLRPLLAWTCWRLAGKKMEIVPLMTMLELMHTTSLIHDDFVDGAQTRRGVPTISAESGGMAAIASGDYLLSRAMEYLKIYRGTGINEALSASAQEMCLGELEQRSGLFDTENLSESAYYSRAVRKTALLMAESCRCGALAGGADAAAVQALREYGLHLGLAFQIRDDLLDYGGDVNTGKAPLQDLRGGVMTLPLIYALKRADRTIKQLAGKREKTEEDVGQILLRVRESGALEKTYHILRGECGMAADSLSSIRDSAEKEALILLSKSISEVKYSGGNKA